MAATANSVGPATEEPEVEEAVSGRRMDEELRILSSILRTLNEVDEPARVRIMAYLSSRYSGEQ